MKSHEVIQKLKAEYPRGYVRIRDGKYRLNLRGNWEPLPRIKGLEQRLESLIGKCVVDAIHDEGYSRIEIELL